MTRLSRGCAAAGRAAARLLPAERRDWAEALWAEAHQVPPGLPRLAWRAGGLRLIAREATMARRLASALLFAGAAALAARAAWPGSPASATTTAARVDVIIIVLLLAVLPLLAHRLWGPATESRLARFLRTGSYAAILALTAAKASAERFAGYPAPAHRPQPPASWLVRPAGTRAPGGGFAGWVLAAQEGLFRPTGGHAASGAVPGPPPAVHYWTGEILFVLVIACCVAAILAVTARRSSVAPATLAIGTGAGVGLGVVMYAVAPLGLAKHATNPWLPGSAVDPLVVLAWVALLGGPLAAGVLAARRYRGPDSPVPSGGRIRQSTVAGLLTTLVGALLVTSAGTGTIALMPRASWLMHWLYPGEHLVAAVARGHVVAAGGAAAGYLLILLAFPFIGLGAGAWGGMSAAEVPGGPGPGGGPPGPGPSPDPPDGGRSAEAEGDADRLLPGVLDFDEDRARDLVGAHGR
jgi:hypothetical protein